MVFFNNNAIFLNTNGYPSWIRSFLTVFTFVYWKHWWLLINARHWSDGFILLLCWCFTALRHFLGNFGCDQLTHSLPVLSAYSFSSDWQLPFLNQRKGENGLRYYFLTKLHERMLPDVRIEAATVRIPGTRGSDRAIRFYDVTQLRQTDWQTSLRWRCFK